MQVYPWALLVFWQLLMPAVSFWGHLGGLLAGELFVRGWLKALVPSEGSFQASPAACKPCRTMQSSPPGVQGAMHARDVHEVIWGGRTRPRGGSGVQRAEGSAVLAPARRWDCYMAHTGGATFMALPTSYSASSPADSSPAGPSAAQQVLCLSETLHGAALQCSLTGSDALKVPCISRWCKQGSEAETCQHLTCLRYCFLCNLHRGRHG